MSVLIIKHLWISLGIRNIDQKLWWPARNSDCGVSTLIHSKPGFPHFTSLHSLTLIDLTVQELRALPKLFSPLFILLVCVSLLRIFYSLLYLFISVCNVSPCFCLLLLLFVECDIRDQVCATFCNPTLHLNILRCPSVLSFTRSCSLLDKDSSSCAVRVSCLY